LFKYGKKKHHCLGWLASYVNASFNYTAEQIIFEGTDNIVSVRALSIFSHEWVQSSLFLVHISML